MLNKVLAGTLRLTAAGVDNSSVTRIPTLDGWRAVAISAVVGVPKLVQEQLSDQQLGSCFVPPVLPQLRAGCAGGLAFILDDAGARAHLPKQLRFGVWCAMAGLLGGGNIRRIGSGTQLLRDREAAPAGGTEAGERARGVARRSLSQPGDSGRRLKTECANHHTGSGWARPTGVRSRYLFLA